MKRSRPKVDDKGGTGRDLKIEHKGLEILAGMDVTEIVRKFGEQATIELVSDLVSGSARRKSHVNKILRDRGFVLVSV